MQKLCGSHKNVNDFKLGEECILTCLVLEIPCVGHGLDMNLNWDFTHTISDLTCDLEKKSPPEYFMYCKNTSKTYQRYDRKVV